MPLTKKGKKVKLIFVKEYGEVEGKRIFYAWENKHKTNPLNNSIKLK